MRRDGDQSLATIDPISNRIRDALIMLKSSVADDPIRRSKELALQCTTKEGCSSAHTPELEVWGTSVKSIGMKLIVFSC